MKNLHFEELDLYKDDKLQGYIEETNDSKDKFIYWLCPEGVKGINELDLHYQGGIKTTTAKLLHFLPMVHQQSIPRTASQTATQSQTYQATNQARRSNG